MIDDEVFMTKHSIFQRCLLPGKTTVRPFGCGRTGLDATSEAAILTVLSWDYMGAAEFERGECSKCLVYMYDNRDKLVATEHNGHYFLSVKKVVEQAHQLWDAIRQVGEDGKLDLKKRDWPMRHNPFANNAVGWFDFKNGFFVSTQKEMRDNLHKLLLEMTHQ